MHLKFDVGNWVVNNVAPTIGQISKNTKSPFYFSNMSRGSKNVKIISNGRDFLFPADLDIAKNSDRTYFPPGDVKFWDVSNFSPSTSLGSQLTFV